MNKEMLIEKISELKECFLVMGEECSTQKERFHDSRVRAIELYGEIGFVISRFGGIPQVGTQFNGYFDAYDTVLFNSTHPHFQQALAGVIDHLSLVVGKINQGRLYRKFTNAIWRETNPFWWVYKLFLFLLREKRLAWLLEVLIELTRIVLNPIR